MVRLRGSPSPKARFSPERVASRAARSNYGWRLSSGPAIALATPLTAEPATLTPVSTTVPATLTVVETAVPAMDRTVHPAQSGSNNRVAVKFFIAIRQFDFDARSIGDVDSLWTMPVMSV